MKKETGLLFVALGPIDLLVGFFGNIGAFQFVWVYDKFA